MTARMRKRPLARFDRGLHGLRIGVHGEEARAEPRHALDALRDRVADVVQLEIEEHALAGAGKRLREGKPAGEGELIADLVERYRIAEPRHHAPALLRTEGRSSATIRRSRGCRLMASASFTQPRGMSAAISTSRRATRFKLSRPGSHP